MPKVADYYFKTAIVFLVIGIGLGLQMSISGDHSAMGAHAHLNLLGWATGALFGIYFTLNPARAARRLAMVQFGVYMLGIVVMIPALYLLLQGNPGAEPFVAAGSMIVFAGVLLFAVIVFTPATDAAPQRAPAE